ncbi:excinuclease ABC subunit B [Sphingomonas koreensis]|nr:excinuclease ABC subunit B [Sphingomonas koreensis]
MNNDIADLQARMDAAAAALDFEEARRLRDRIALLRQGAGAEAIAAVEAGDLLRQQPGAMGLGTSQQRMTPPDGWTKPAKPDPMTRGRGTPRGRRKPIQEL